LGSARPSCEGSARFGEEALDALEEALAERDQEIGSLSRLADLEEQLLDHLFCAPCGEWVNLSHYAEKRTRTGADRTTGRAATTARA